VIGAYVMAHGLRSLERVVRYVIDRAQREPGIRAGRHVCHQRSHYVGAMHQPDVVVVAPILSRGRLTMWCGSVGTNGVGGSARRVGHPPAPTDHQEAFQSHRTMVEAGGSARTSSRDVLSVRAMPELNALDSAGRSPPIG